MTEEQTPERAIERRFFGVIEVDSGTFVIGDPAYLLPDQADGKPGVDYAAVTDAAGEDVAVQIANHTAVLVQNFGGDATFPVYAEFEDGELARVIIELDWSFGEDAVADE